MRVERALAKLRDRLARCGINSTAAGLATLVAGHAATPVPASVVSAATSAALAAETPAAAGIGLTLLNAKLVMLGIGAVPLKHGCVRAPLAIPDGQSLTRVRINTVPDRWYFDQRTH